MIVIGTPGRLLDVAGRDILDLRGVEYVVMDRNPIKCWIAGSCVIFNASIQRYFLRGGRRCCFRRPFSRGFSRLQNRC